MFTDNGDGRKKGGNRIVLYGKCQVQTPCALMQGLYREIQGVIDDNMKKQLSGKRLTAFDR